MYLSIRTGFKLLGQSRTLWRLLRSPKRPFGPPFRRPFSVASLKISDPERGCRVLKLFRTSSKPGLIVRNMKLNKTKVRWILRQKRKGVATKDIARDMKVSTRRVQQVLKEYRDTGEEPCPGKNLGRPAKPYDEQEAQIVKEAHERYRFGARMLEQVIRKQYKIRISHNRIHMYLKAQGLAQEDQKKQKQRKWVRYEREHSLSAGHIDWHEWDGTGIKVCVVLDDASRMVLAGGEFSVINTENSKLVIDQLVEKFWWLCPMRELILDHGSEFGAHRIHDDGSWNSDFKNQRNYSAPNNQHRQTQLMRCRVASSRELTSSNFVSRYRFPF